MTAQPKSGQTNLVPAVPGRSTSIARQTGLTHGVGYNGLPLGSVAGIRLVQSPPASARKDRRDLVLIECARQHAPPSYQEPLLCRARHRGTRTSRKAARARCSSILALPTPDRRTGPRDARAAVDALVGRSAVDPKKSCLFPRLYRERFPRERIIAALPAAKLLSMKRLGGSGARHHDTDTCKGCSRKIRLGSRTVTVTSLQRCWHDPA